MGKTKSFKISLFQNPPKIGHQLCTFPKDSTFLRVLDSIFAGKCLKTNEVCRPESVLGYHRIEWNKFHLPRHWKCFSIHSYLFHFWILIISCRTFAVEDCTIFSEIPSKQDMNFSLLIPKVLFDYSFSQFFFFECASRLSINKNKFGVHWKLIFDNFQPNLNISRVVY